MRNCFEVLTSQSFVSSLASVKFLSIEVAWIDPSWISSTQLSFKPLRALSHLTFKLVMYGVKKTPLQISLSEFPSHLESLSLTLGLFTFEAPSIYCLANLQTL